MFLKRHDHDLLDLSIDLHEPQDWKPGALRTFEYALKVTALAYEPIGGLLAVGTAVGSIELLGNPGVECQIDLPDPHGVKILHISASTFRLLCLDDHNTLYIWDLSTYGRPKLLSSTRFDQTNSITISPSHSHAFITLLTGEIRTYDLACLRKSEYSMPNMWSLYEKKMAASGMPEIATPTSGIAIDTLVHPRDLNLLFVVYGGGIVLSNLSERNTLRTYELVLPPGAPGGGGYGSDILTHRRPEATCMAIHPAGHFFAVGHADGSVAFWAVEDEDQPLLVCTLDDIDVNIVDAVQLEAHLSQSAAASPRPEREPVFKLSWCSFPNSSDPRGGDTALVILGGLNSRDSPGVTVHWLSAFNPLDPPSPLPSTALHPFIRKNMRSSVESSKTYFYDINGTVQDYILAPRENPHFSGAFDPMAILIVRETVAGLRVVEAHQFPPPAFSAKAHEDSHEKKEEEEDTLDDLASTLRALHMSDEPRRLGLPGYLSNGCSGLLNGSLRTVNKDSYESLTQPGTDYDFPLRSGFAWLDPIENLAKYQPPRILITWHADLTVQIWDASAQLLHKFKPEPLESGFPSPLSNLTIDTNSILTDATVLPKITDQHFTIQSVELASESLECAVVLSTGLVVLYRLIAPPSTLPPFQELPDPELLSLKHLSANLGSRFCPYFLLSPDKGNVTACSLADIGFLAVAYADGSLYVIDMRGPIILLRHGKRSPRHSIGLHLASDSTDIAFTSLQWTISPMESDEKLALRLVAARLSGVSQVFTFGRSPDGSWVSVGEPAKFDSPVQPLEIFVIGSKNGHRCTANRSRLAAIDDSYPSNESVLAIVAGAKGARCHLNITGDRVGKTDWSSKMGKVLGFQIVQKLSSYALVAFTDKHEACAYSLPDLEFMHNLALPPVSYLPPVCDETGDFITWTRDPQSGSIRQATYATLFNFRRVDTVPAVDFLSSKPVVPAQPQPVSVGPTSILGSWFRSSGTLTGAQVDTLLGGPDRPVHISQPRPKPASSDPVTEASQVANEAAATQNTLYSRLTAALEDRGQMLGDLEDRFNSLESGSRSMVDQAKRLAAEQSTKRWFKFS